MPPISSLTSAIPANHYATTFAPPSAPASPSAPATPQPPDVPFKSAARLARGHQGMIQLQKHSVAATKLKENIKTHIEQALENNNSESPSAAQGLQADLDAAKMLRDLIDELPGQLDTPESDRHELEPACRDVVASLDTTISHLELLISQGTGDSYKQDFFNAPHPHDASLFDKLKKRFLGTSDLDEAPHAVVGAKAGISAVINRDTPREHTGDAGAQKDAAASAPANMPHAADHDAPTRLQAFQSHSVPHGSGELATDMALSGVIGLAGFMAATAGRGERKEATHEKKDATRLLDRLEKEKQALDTLIASQVAGAAPVYSTEMLKKERAILEWQIASLNFTLDNVGKKKQVGVGSELAGWQMMLKGVIDGVCKPLAYSGTGGAQATDIAASVSGFATTVLSPGAAASGLWMGISAKRFFKAERESWQALLDIAVRQSGLQPGHMPADIRADFVRVFTEGKWVSNAKRLRSINRLLNWFVGGMCGYTGAMAGLSIHNLVQLAVAGSIMADLSMSCGVITATGAVLIGTLAFLRHHAKFHDYEHWLEEGHPDVDLDLLRELAAGGQSIGEHAVDTLQFYEGKEMRRQEFLYRLAAANRRRYDKLTTHSTDSDEVRNQLSEWKEGSRRTASQRFTAAKARGREFGSYVARSAQQLATPGEWRSAFQSARESVASGSEGGDHGHHHGHHHAHSDAGSDASSHDHERFSALKSGVRFAFAPLRRGARIAGRTVTNTFAPAKRKARQTYADHTDRLTEIKLVELLQSPDAATRDLVREFLKAEAEENANFAQRRLQTAMEGFASEAKLDETTNRENSAVVAELPDALKERFRNKGLRLGRDQEHINRAADLHERIRTLQDDEAVPDGVLADAAHLHQWSNPEASDGQQGGARRLAEYLWKGAPDEFRKARLCLTTGVLKLAPLMESVEKARRAEQDAAALWTTTATSIEGDPPPSGNLLEELAQENPNLWQANPASTENPDR